MILYTLTAYILALGTLTGAVPTPTNNGLVIPTLALGASRNPPILTGVGKIPSSNFQVKNPASSTSRNQRYNGVLNTDPGPFQYGILNTDPELTPLPTKVKNQSTKVQRAKKPTWSPMLDFLDSFDQTEPEIERKDSDDDNIRNFGNLVTTLTNRGKSITDRYKSCIDNYSNFQKQLGNNGFVRDSSRPSTIVRGPGHTGTQTSLQDLESFIHTKGLGQIKEGGYDDDDENNLSINQNDSGDFGDVPEGTKAGILPGKRLY